MEINNETTTAIKEIDKYCNICGKTCGHWEIEHDAVYDSNKPKKKDETNKTS